MIGIAAGETENPEKNVPKAIHAAVWRLMIFFVGTIIVISSLLTYTDAGLQVGGHGGLSSSPFVSVFTQMGIPYAKISSFRNYHCAALYCKLWTLCSFTYDVGIVFTKPVTATICQSQQIRRALCSSLGHHDWRLAWSAL